jgi:hypothetical protein
MRTSAHVGSERRFKGNLTAQDRRVDCSRSLASSRGRELQCHERVAECRESLGGDGWEHFVDQVRRASSGLVGACGRRAAAFQETIKLAVEAYGGLCESEPLSRCRALVPEESPIGSTHGLWPQRPDACRKVF